jgi:predicted Kef-type K+ transport protein
MLLLIHCLICLAFLGFLAKQDLAVVVLLILIPLISPNSSKGGVGFNAIAEALGLAAVKAVVAITGIIAGGRLVRIVVLVQMK